MFRKKIKGDEYVFLNILKDTDIIPNIISLTRNLVTMEKYSMTMEEYVRSNEFESVDDFIVIKKKIDVLIGKLHDLGIYHGDLHSCNIVISPESEEVRIIDFGESRFIKDIVDDDIEYFNDFLDPDVKFKCVYDMLTYEKDNWIRDFF